MSGSAFWHVMIPTDRNNFVPNPSYELIEPVWWFSGTNVHIGRALAPACAYDGAAGLRGTSGATTGTWNIASGRWRDLRPGTVYTTSVHVVNYTTGTLTATLRALGTSVTAPIPPDGQWRRVVAVGPNGAGTPHGTLTIFKTVADVGSIGVDAWQCEIGTIATPYFDGDHEDAIWRGIPHLDDSYQPASARWGPLVSLASLGFLVEEHAGVGAPPMEPPTMPSAGPAIGTRTISLSGVMLGTSTASLHATRERLLRHLAPWDGDCIQPVRLAYAGAGGTWTIDAAYQSGLEISDMSVASERVTVTMRAVDPYWRAMRRIGGTLQTTQPFDLLPGTFTSVLALDPRGNWQILARTPAVGTNIYHVNADRPGTIIVCGEFTTVNGTTAPRIAMIANGTAFPLIGQGGSLGIASGVVLATRWQPVDDEYRLLVFGSNMATPAGTRSMLRYRFPSFFPEGAWQTMYSPEGSAASEPIATPALLYDGLQYGNGTVIIAGNITGGLRFVAAGTAFASPYGSINGWARAIAYLSATEIVVAGSFTAAGGTPCRHIASLDLANGRWGTYRWDPGTPIAALAVTPRQELYAYVQHANAGTVGYWQVRRGGAERLGGQFWSDGWHAPNFVVARPFAVDGDGHLHAVLGTISTHRNNRFGAAGISRTAWIGRWSRGVWEYVGIIGGITTTHGMAISPDGTRYMVGKYEQLLQCDGISMIHNAASAPTPLLIRISAQYVPVTCVKLANLTTRRGIYGLLDGPSFDVIVVDAVKNTVFNMTSGDLRSNLDMASHPRNLTLAPGTNWIMAHGVSGIQIMCSWRPTALSPDGTI